MECNIKVWRFHHWMQKIANAKRNYDMAFKREALRLLLTSSKRTWKIDDGLECEPVWNGPFARYISS